MLQEVRKIIRENIEKATKGVVKITLVECLNSLTVQRLREFATTYAIEGRAKMNKAQLINELMKKINNKSHIHNVLKCCRSEFLELLVNLYNCEEEDFSTKFISEYRGFQQLGIIYTYTNGQIVKAIIPREIKNTLRELNLVGLLEIQKRYEVVEKYIDSFANVYGIYEVELLIEAFNNYEEEKLTVKEFDVFFEKYSSTKKYLKYHENKIIHELILIDESFRDVLKNREGKKYYLLSRQQIENYSEINYIEITSNHRKLREFIRGFCKDKKMAESIFVEICIPLRNGELEIGKALNSFDTRKIQLKNIKKLDEFTKLVSKVESNTRKWMNKGYTNRELRKLREREGKEPKRNGPCPCGSGKKYKHCCGKINVAN